MASPEDGGGKGLAEPAFFVGSPEQVSSFGGSLINETTMEYSRPSLGARSISSPHTSPTRPSEREGSNSFSATTQQTPSTSFRRSQVNDSRRPQPTPRQSPSRSRRGYHTPREHQWSVFGQLMENEAIPTNANVTSRPRDSWIDINYAVRVGEAEQVRNPIMEEDHRVPVAIHTDSESDSDDETFVSDTSEQDDTDGRKKKIKEWWTKARQWQVPIVWRNVLKCSIAYFIASLFTFWPLLSELMGDLSPSNPRQPTDSAQIPLSFPFLTSLIASPRSHPSGHMVATVAVYYNPAKTMGAMVEANIFCIFGLLYAALVSLTSMNAFWWLEVREGWEWLGDVVAILGVGVGMSILAWAKVWMGSPQFGTACSMISLIIFVVVVKEGGLATLLSISFIVICGTAVSNLVCFFLWPQSATTSLRTNLTKTLSSFSTLLDMLTTTFLLEEGRKRGEQRVIRAIEAHQGSFTALRKGLAEAARERGMADPKAYEDAVDSINRLAQHLNGLRSGIHLQFELTANKNDDASLEAAAEMFDDMVEEMGPPLKALSSSCISALKRLRDSFSHDVNFAGLSESIERALMRFESTSNHAVLRLYRRSGTAVFDGESGESVFLVYFFIFTLQEFSTELVALVDAVGRIYTAEKRAHETKGLFNRIKSLVKRRPLGPRERPSRGGLKRQLSSLVLPSQHRSRPIFPKVRPHAPNTMLTPPLSSLSYINRVRRIVWSVGKRMGERDVRYGVKVGMSTALLASLAFIPPTRPFFLKWRGEWALISFWVVLSPTIGATNFTSFHRVLWTLVGATIATSVYTLFPSSPVLLALFGFFFSIPCFYYLVTRPQYATAARFALLTYNLTGLYCYNARERETPISVVDVAFHRSCAVIFGVLYAAVVARFWWPAEARRELGRELSAFCLNIGWLYTRLVASNSFAPEYAEEDTPLLSRLNNSIQEFMAMELHLQIKLIELQGLLAQTQHEPRLKGPFPVQLYRGVLISLQVILDRLHSMRCVTTREEWLTSVRQDFIIPVNAERHAMVGNILVYFSLLSAAFQLKMPLPPYLPPAEESRARLVDAIRRLDVVRNRDAKGSRQLLFFAYALTMKGVTRELESLGKILQDAFGVIGFGRGAEEFEALFAVPV